MRQKTAARKPKPVWDGANHTLTWQGQLVKHFKAAAPRQEAILAAFQKALTASVAELEPEVVNLLRLVAVEGLQTAQLAKLFRLDRATVKRRVASARKRVVESTRARLGLSPSEFRSLAALVQSQLHLSFGPAPRPERPP